MKVAERIGQPHRYFLSGKSILSINLPEEKSAGTRKQDRLFHHHLVIRDARRHLAHLRKKATSELPEMPLYKVAIRINYTKLPETYDVKPIQSIKQNIHNKNGISEARVDALVDKVRRFFW